MAWTDPRTWTIGEKVTKAIMDTHVRDNLNSLKSDIANTPLTVQSSIAPMSGYAAAALQLLESTGAGTAKPVIYELLFDATTDEGRMWSFRANKATGTVTLNVSYYMKSANTSKKIKLSAQLAAVSSGDTSVTAKVFAAANTANPTVPDAIGTKANTTITMTNADSIADGDWVCLFLQRVPSDGTNDTADGDVAVTDIELLYV
jgi:hypothetical protein